MTKERKLAIKMWEQIKEEFIKDDSDPFTLMRLKSNFTQKYGLRWKHDCYFCQYVRKNDNIGLVQGCQKCPIATFEARLNKYTCGCNKYSIYHFIHSYYIPKFMKIFACNKIIKALKRKYK